jgi:hypothetical protein
LSDFAETPNQQATAPALQQVLGSGSADSQTILSSLSVLPASQVPNILDEVAGESLLIVRSAPGGADAVEALLSSLQARGVIASYRLRTGSLEQLYRALAAG